MRRIAPSQYLLEVRLLREKVPSFQGYPFSLPVVRHLHTLRFHPKVTFIIGENATGKSTLLEAVAVGLRLNPEGGDRNIQFETRPSHSPLHEALRLVRSYRRPKDMFFLRAESLFNLGTAAENRGASRYGPRPLHEQSHGESFYALFMNRFGGGGLYILDEPEAALSPMRQMGLLTIIHDLVSRHSQFIIATHSPIIMSYPDAWIYELTEVKTRKVRLTETEHFVITKRFLNDPERMLAILLKDEAEA